MIRREVSPRVNNLLNHIPITTLRIPALATKLLPPVSSFTAENHIVFFLLLFIYETRFMYPSNIKQRLVLGVLNDNANKQNGILTEDIYLVKSMFTYFDPRF